MMQRLLDQITALLASRRFFYGVIGFFIFEILWVAFSAVYPMAFDEDFHLGIIKIYSQQWLPFLAGQPEGANVFGALPTDPSYLFHYLMSFPYRIVTALTDSVMAQVIALRLTSGAFLVWAVFVFRSLLIRIGMSAAFTHVAILLFTLVPAVALLAGQINYDSLMILCVAWTCVLVYCITQALQSNRLDVRSFVLLVLVCMFGSLVKYPFLPIAIAVVIFLVIMLVRTFRGRGAQCLQAWREGYAAVSGRAKLGLLALLLVMTGLFVQRYGVNLVRYGNPVPACDAVIGVDACMAYGPWGRNYLLEQQKGDVDPNPLAYAWVWVQALHYRSFFMVNGPASNFLNYPPVPLPSVGAILVAIFGVGSMVFYWRKTFTRQPFFAFIALMTVVYVVILWTDTYTQFLETGEPVAINGRYLIPLLLPLAALFGRSLSIALRLLPRVQIAAAAVVVLLFLQGGGVLSFMSRSDASWYWPNNTVVGINEVAQRVVNVFIFEGPKSY